MIFLAGVILKFLPITWSYSDGIRPGNLEDIATSLGPVCEQLRQIMTKWALNNFTYGGLF